MKVLFANVPWWQTGPHGELRGGIRAGSRWPFTVQTRSAPDAPAWGEYLPMPQFMASAAAWCQKHTDAEVILRDSIARRESYETFLAYYAQLRPDFLVVETATPSWGHDRQVLKILEDISPKTRILIVGTITTTHHAEILAIGYTPIAGEYEKGVVRAIRGEKGYIQHDFLTKEELNSAPFPLYDEEVALRYWDACPDGQKSPHLQIWTSRGCYARCCFCAFPAVMTNNDPDGLHARKVRFHTPEYIRALIADRLAKYPSIACIYDDSDIFNMGDKHTLAMSAVFKEFGLPWTAMCRADSVKLETWNAMKEAGCVGVKIGMESGSQRVLDKIVNKGLDLLHVEQIVLPHLKSIGLKVHTTWTAGLPGEKPDEAQETVRMIERLYAKGLHHTHQLSGTATIEGTPLDSIAQGKELTAYPDADARGFLVNGDGQAKVESMARLLR
jgi:radical SAM superfamily enzyme YgiQ (UPF0313 family)